MVAAEKKRVAAEKQGPLPTYADESRVETILGDVTVEFKEEARSVHVEALLEAQRESLRDKEPEIIQNEAPMTSGVMQGMFSCAACACTEKMPSSGTLPASGVPLDVNHSRDIFSEAVVQRWASGPPRAPPQRGGNITGTMPIEATGALPGGQFVEPESGVAGIRLSTHIV